MSLKPSEIYYSQDSINAYFDKRCQYSHQRIGETLDDICEGRCSNYDIPTISVFNQNGRWITADNRRLWVFRHLERLGKCSVIPVRQTYYIPDQKMTALGDGDSVRVRGPPGGYWHNRSSSYHEQTYSSSYMASPQPYRPYNHSPSRSFDNIQASISREPSYSYSGSGYGDYGHQRSQNYSTYQSSNTGNDSGWGSWCVIL